MPSAASELAGRGLSERSLSGLRTRDDPSNRVGVSLLDWDRYGKMNSSVLVIKKEEVTSTNDLLKEMADACPEGTVVVAAKRQTGGRGRNGRRFESPSGGLYFSILLHPAVSSEKVSFLTAAMASAVCEAVRELTGEDAGIKWINDIYVSGKKVCGILTEGRFKPDGTLEYAIVGTGINIEEPDGGYPDEIKDVAGALFKHGDAPAGFGDRLLEEICDTFFSYSEQLDKKPWLNLYRKRSIVLGREIKVSENITDPDSFYTAYAEEINDDFGLVVRKKDGSRAVLSTGEVSIRVLE